MLYSRRRNSYSGRLWIGLFIAFISIVSFLKSKEFNPITGEQQYISLSPQEEIVLGLQSAPEMVNQFDGLDPDVNAQELVDRVGKRIVQQSKANQTEWEFDFHLLADEETINAFALPGGQIFITRALFNELKTEDLLAGVLAHEIVHVVARHSSQQIAKQELAQGLSGAVVTASGDYDTGRLANFVGQIINMKYGREDELQSDQLGVQFMSQAGYDPNAMINVMEVLAKASQGGEQPEFFSTHPNPSNRIERIKQAIRDLEISTE
ncbi:MAG: M48 family metalloprotease [Candidatus Omnitrophica bacterium]|nr:M48 family metalloprotease [Candidatus Omnitrophota bacterium]